MTPNPTKVYAGEDFHLTVVFEDGQVRRVDIRTFLPGSSSVKSDIALFKQAYIEDGSSG